jgi:NADH-quinone oxidoreductase subunit M
VAYSSIAHIGLMCLAIFSTTDQGMNGVMIQMFNHGINVIGLWIIVGYIEKQFGTAKISELGGIAQKAPVLSILLVVFSLANIALPLTNSFVGEFLMFSGVYNSTITKFSTLFTACAIVSIILAAVYTLNMLRRVLFGDMNANTVNAVDMSMNYKLVLSVFVIIILALGVYPQPFFELTSDTVTNILSRMITKTP